MPERLKNPAEAISGGGHGLWERFKACEQREK